MLPTNQPERAEKESVSGTPGKYSMRVSQFVSAHDFEIQRDLPLFKDLGQLREQVYRDLRLPPSNTEVFVYLFEDKEHYEKFFMGYIRLQAARSSSRSRGGSAGPRT